MNSKFFHWERDFQDVKLGRSEEGNKRKEGQRQIKERREAISEIIVEMVERRRRY